MKVSLVMTTFNRSKQLSHGLMTIFSQDFVPDEIVIVDDGSLDDTKQVIEDWQKKFELKNCEVKYIYLDHPEHRISSIPRNIGIKQSTGEVIIFTESECLHVGNTIADLVNKYLDQPNNSHLASQIWSMGQRIWQTLPDYDLDHPLILLNHKYAQLVEGNMQNTKAPDSDWAITGSNNCAAGCLFLVRRDWLEDVGGFDESFEGHGFDDFDLFNRLAIYGHGIIKHDDIIVIHQWHEKNYPYNLYDHAEKNGKKSEDRIHAGIWKVNEDKEWGQI